jgi:5-oxoprolinase (ATP-hydrolysing) subunit A
MDLNVDAGEIPELIANGVQAELLSLVDSCNIACGGHAGDEATITATLAQARGLRIGAHPGYPDRANFGRLSMRMESAELEATLETQIRSLLQLAGQLHHVKPHGALYNDAARDASLAALLARVVQRVDKSLVMVGLAGSAMVAEFRQQGFTTWEEGFCDRAYLADGSLMPRGSAGAVIEDPAIAAEQALRLQHLDTLCIHGDHPHAIAIARAVRAQLRSLS